MSRPACGTPTVPGARRRFACGAPLPAGGSGETEFGGHVDQLTGGAVVTDLAQVPPEWVQLVDDEQRLTVVELDDAAAEGAPWVGWPVQLALAVALHQPDPTGQPYDDEHAQLLAWQDAVVAALGPAGRIVATITLDGVREVVAYLRSADPVLAWEHAPPAGLVSHEVVVQLLPDPTWIGLREIAGLLEDGEEPLRPPQV